jgi:AcrR family transcriptional regulator
MFSYGDVQMLTKSENTINNIMSSAATLFTAKNYADVTMGQIAQASQVTKGAVYHHFTSKEELYFELIHTDLARKKELFERAIAAGRTCRDRLGRLTRAFFEMSRTERELIKLVRRDNHTFAEAPRAELIRAYQSSLPELIEGVIRDGINNGELAPADPRLLSWHFVALVEVTLGDYADRVFDDSDTKLDFVLDQFFSGAAGTRQGDPE